MLRKHAAGLLDEADAILEAIAEAVYEVPAAWRGRRTGEVYIAAADLADVRRALRRLAHVARALRRVVLRLLGHGAVLDAAPPPRTPRSWGCGPQSALAALTGGIGNMPPPKVKRLLSYEDRRLEAYRLIHELERRFGTL